MISPPRIVSLLSSATEILCALGLDQQLLAVSHECDFPKWVNRLPRATCSNVDSSQTSQTIDEQVKSLFASQRHLYEIEQVLLRRLAPDLIVTQSQCDVCAVKYADVLDLVTASPELQHTRVVALNPSSLDDVLSDILRLGAETDTSHQAELLVRSYQARIDAIRSKTEKLPESQRPRVACIEWIEPLMLAGNWTPQLIDWAGGRSQLTTAGLHSGYTNWDQFLQNDPDIVIVSPCGFDLPRTLQEASCLQQHPHWRRLTAVRHGNVFAMDGNAYLNRSGPRLIESLEILAHLLHPQRFSAPQSLWLTHRDFCALTAK